MNSPKPIMPRLNSRAPTARVAPRVLRAAIERLEERQLMAATPPTARFDWSMPPRYGADLAADGTLHPWAVKQFKAYEAKQLDPAFLSPARWTVNLDASHSSGDITGYQWVARRDDGDVYEGAAQQVFATTKTSPRLTSSDFPAQGRYEVTLTVTARDGQTAARTQTVVVKDQLVVSLGDSYASGQGVPDVPGTFGTAQWLNYRAARSEFAAPAIMAQELERQDPHSSVTFVHLAASGAIIGNDNPGDKDGGLLDPYEGQNPPSSPHAKLPPQVDVVKGLLAATRRTIDALTVSIGGNDLGFSTHVAGCLALPRYDLLSGASGLAGKMKDLTKDGGRYDKLAAALHDLGAPVYITEYPDLTRDAAGHYWAQGPAGTAEVSIDRYEAKWAREKLIGPLNAAIHQKAAKFGWTVVGGMEGLWAGHGWGASASQRWMNLVSEGLANQGAVDGGFHPNLKGHRANAGRLLQTVRLGSVHGSVFEDGNGNTVRDAGEGPRPGRTVRLIDLATRAQVLAVETDSVGSYSFGRLAAGNYVIKTDPVPGWVTPASRAVTIGTPAVGGAAGGAAQTVVADLRTSRPALLAGRAYVDANANGRYDAGEPGVAGCRVFLDGGYDNGRFDSGEPYVVTAADGTYTFGPSFNLLPGQVSVGAELMTQTTLARLDAGSRPVDIAAGRTAGPVDFGFRRTPAVLLSGRVFLDADGDGTLGAGEAGIAGCRVFLDGGDENGAWDAGEPYVLTQDDGTFRFGPDSALISGTVQVTVASPSTALAPSTPTAREATLVVGQETAGVRFGFTPQRLFGASPR
jgi:hypothetical protein